MCFGDDAQSPGCVETGVVEYDHRAFWKFWQQDFLEPFVEYGSVAHAGEPQWREQCAHHKTRDNTDTRAAIARARGEATFAFGAAPVSVRFIIVDSRFIDKDAQTLRHFCQFLQEPRLLLRAGFFVAIRLFFLV